MAFYFISWWAFCFFVVIVLLFLIHANIIPALFLGLISWWLNVSPAPLWFKEKVHLTPLNFCQGLKINPELLNWVLNPPQLLISCKSLRAIESPPTQPYIHLNELEEKIQNLMGPHVISIFFFLLPLLISCLPSALPSLAVAGQPSPTCDRHSHRLADCMHHATCDAHGHCLKKEKDMARATRYAAS